jgi:two-component sensor histidine kinase
MVLSVVDTTDARAAAIINDGLIADKVMLMRELQHRIANSLQIIASVLMQSARRVTNDETRDSLQVAHNRVLSVATMQEHLTSSGTDDIELRPYFSQLCQSIGASMIAFPDELSITVECEDVAVPSATSISLGLIVTELVINSLKHAFPDEAGGKIIVSYQTQGGGWSLGVMDDGVGMPAGTSGNPGAVAGLGTSIIEALARLLEAGTVIADAHPGTNVSIVHESSKAIGSDPLPLVEAI